MGRVVLVAALIGGTALGSYAAYEERDLQLERAATEAEASAALNREVAVAEALGFTKVEEVALTLPATFGERAAHPVSLAQGECVAAVVGLWGWHSARRFSLARSCDDNRDQEVSTETHFEGLVGHVQWCATEPVGLYACVQSTAPSGRWEEHEAGPRPARLVILRGDANTIGGSAGLNRGFLLP